jgi:hypothetical protein
MVLSSSGASGVVASQDSDSDALGVHALHFVALYAGRRRMKTAGWRLRALPGLEVVFLNSKKGKPVVRRWGDGD